MKNVYSSLEVGHMLISDIYRIWILQPLEPKALP